MKGNRSFELPSPETSPKTMQRKIAVSFTGIFILTLATLYYFYEFFLRVILGTIATELMQDLSLGAEQFALIGSAYYLTYSVMQTPVGILVDRYGVKFLLSSACLICTLGVFLFAFANGFALAFLSRFLIGFGSSFAFVSILILALNWFPREQFAFLAGMIQFLGSVGPFLGGAPLSYVLTRMGNDWRSLLIWIGAFGIVLSLSLLLFLKTAPKGSSKEFIYLSKTESLKQKLAQLVKNKQVWWTVFYAGSIYGTLPILGAFWGTSYLRSKGFDREASAFMISMIWIGLAVGCPIFGKISDLIKRRKAILLFVALLGITTSCTVLYLSSNSKILLCGLFFCIGLASSGQSVSFAVISEHVPRKLHATAIGLNNTMITFFGFLVPPIVGVLIEYANPGYGNTLTEQAFEFGFLTIPVLYAIAFLIAAIGIKETYCRQQNEVYHVHHE